MPSRKPWRAWVLVLLVGAGCGARAADAPPSRTQVEEALQGLRDDPLLNGTEMKGGPKRRHPVKEEPEKKKRQQDEKTKSDWDGGGLAEGIAEAGRVLIWVLGAAALIFLALGLRRWVRTGAFKRETKLQTLPSHVRDLDIRPDSLPELVGQAAWALWQRGEARAALSLLYRAMLSRLVHVHGVPILSASTEGECVQLARGRLAPGALAFVEHIVGAWQMAVYGARQPDAAWIQQLCERFDAELPTPAASLQGGAP